MAMIHNYVPLKDSVHPHPPEHRDIAPTDGAQELTVTIMLRRRGGQARREPQASTAARPTREAFAAARGADPAEIAEVEAFAKEAGLEVVESDAARRTVIVKGTVAAANKAFGVELHDYEYARGKYRGHAAGVSLPADIAPFVEAVVGLTNRKVRAVHHSTLSRKKAPADPPNTVALTPAQVAALYDFPDGDGEGETIALYEMETSDAQGNPAPAGYALSDVQGTMQALGNLPMPTLVDVPIDGTSNSGSSDGETGLDITVAGAIAPKATIAVYFAGAQVQNMLHALQAMIHPTSGQPVPSIISISYGWGADDPGGDNFSDAEYQQFTELFDDAATNHISVFVSAGDSGCYAESRSQAQVTYPATDPWVTACGGTTIGDIRGGGGAQFDEWVWNDQGATGGGISARFPVQNYQSSVHMPNRNGTNQPGRGVPDIAGNASENSGYLQVIGGQQPSPVGGTSAVAPLYAGLMARINANLGRPAGFLNPHDYGLPATAFNDVTGAQGPTSNSYQGVSGYPAGAGWDACTGFGSVKGKALQDALQALTAGLVSSVTGGGPSGGGAPAAAAQPEPAPVA
jgi:kumamolisin